MKTSPANLLPCHCHLLDRNFHDHGNGETIHQQLWITSMESAISAAFNVSTGHFTRGSLQIFNNTRPQHVHTAQLTIPSIALPDIAPHLPGNHAIRHSQPHSGPPLIHNQSCYPPQPHTPLIALERTTAYTGNGNSHRHNPGLVGPDCIQNWTRMPYLAICPPSVIALPIWRKRKTKLCLP